jgi:hypothetical protein
MVVAEMDILTMVVGMEGHHFLVDLGQLVTHKVDNMHTIILTLLLLA